MIDTHVHLVESDNFPCVSLHETSPDPVVKGRFVMEVFCLRFAIFSANPI